MEWSELADRPLAWLSNENIRPGEYPFAILTRIQSYRNFAGFPFVVSAPPNICAAIADKAMQLLSRGGKFTLRRLIDCPPAVIRLLRERLFLPDRAVALPGKSESKYLALDLETGRWALINEVEHLTFGSVHPGIPMETDFPSLHSPPEGSGASYGFTGEAHPWAWSSGLGFLTSHPGRIGPGMCIQILVHLPGLALARQLPQARNTMAAFGISLQPIYPAAAADAGLFLLQAPGGAGQTPVGQYGNFLGAIKPLLAWEKGLQLRCLELNRKILEERVQASLESLLQSQVLTYSDLLAKGSYARLGAYLGILDPKIAEIMEVLRVSTGSGHLGVSSIRILPKEEEDKRRAKVVRLRLEKHRTC